MCVALDTRAPRTLAQAGSPQGEGRRVGGPSEELRTKRRRDGARIVEVLLCKSYRERKLRRNKLVLRRKGEVKEARMDAAKRTMGVDLIETKKTAWRTQPPPGRITDGLGAAIRWVGDSFDRSVPRDAVRWGTFNAQGTGGKGLGSTESLDGHWGPLDKLLNEFYGVHGHVLVVTDPGCSVEGLSMIVRRSVVARAYKEATGRPTAVFGLAGRAKASVLFLVCGEWVARVQATHRVWGDRLGSLRFAMGHHRLQIGGVYGWSGANTDADKLTRNEHLLCTLVDMADRCSRRNIELLVGGDFNMVMREQDVGTVTEGCLVAINGFAAAVGMESAFIDRFPDLEDRKTVYTYSWQDGGTSTSLIDHLFADPRRVLAVGIARHDGRLDSDHRMVLCDYRLEGGAAQGAEMPKQLPGHIFDRVFEYSLKKLRHYRPARTEWAALTARMEELARRDRPAEMCARCFRRNVREEATELWRATLASCKRMEKECRNSPKAIDPVGTGQDGSAARLAILVRRWRQALTVGRAAVGRPMSQAQKARVLLKVRNLVLGSGRVRAQVRKTWSQAVGESATNSSRCAMECLSAMDVAKR